MAPVAKFGEIEIGTKLDERWLYVPIWILTIFVFVFTVLQCGCCGKKKEEKEKNADQDKTNVKTESIPGKIDLSPPLPISKTCSLVKKAHKSDGKDDEDSSIIVAAGELSMAPKISPHQCAPDEEDMGLSTHHSLKEKGSIRTISPATKRGTTPPSPAPKRT